MLTQLKQWKTLGLLRSIDYHFAKFISELGGDNLTTLSAAFCSEYLGLGHICLPLEELVSRLNDKCLSSDLNLQNFCQTHDVECLLQNSQVTHALLSESLCVGDMAPLSLQFNALYLTRYAQFEQLIADKLLDQPPVSLSTSSKADLDALFTINYDYLWQAWRTDNKQSVSLLCEKYLDVLPHALLDWDNIEIIFKQAKCSQDLQALASLIAESERCDWQKVSAAVALSSARCVISGGPGTGKTTTVSKLLVLLLKAQPDLLIKMVAPTGKAAARLSESIGHALGELDITAELKERIPSEASTIHRLLGVKANSNHFRHDQSNKLHLDLLLVDEASMVDLPLMAKLLMAIPDHARLILLGDKDQLASVEAGAVLGDICYFIESGYSQEKAQSLADLSGFSCLVKPPYGSENMADNLCLLRKSYRFDQYSGIGYLAKGVNAGDITSKKVVKLCHDYDDLSYFVNNELSLPVLDKLILEGYTPYLQSIAAITTANRDTAKKLLKQFNQFKLLCATREGEWAVDGLNKRCERVLSKAGLICKAVDQQENGRDTWYIGRPVMITQNNYHLGLYNGDIGLCLLDEEDQLRVYFQTSDATIADFQPSRLPKHETVFAMTVHKSQGSEFDHTVFILPDHHLPVVTRELIYTGITRAKKQLTLFVDLPILVKAIKHKTQRASRLVARLQNGIGEGHDNDDKVN
ncbi:exodeoxyribonuclease V subunit alpha [Psychromonas antarctica]|uniref:exodeoxyribonuclease V subunit alpha n=1 Tax=Psychromonas antarctica TaxID=67573 RepID=UPI001EE98956|nr:exodeoxyribonuclease V subunit alpha [Psychromonas antarctica]MCG6202045.1 exodeoxyribonuclease V subunit alpha [Psychromonas antarctica]